MAPLALSSQDKRPTPFNDPDNGERVRWDGHRDLAPSALLMDKGAPLLLMGPWLGGAYRDLLCPDPAYVLYRYEAGTWRKIPLTPLRGMKIRPNLTGSPSDAMETIRAHGNHLDWALAGGHVRGSNVRGTNIDFTSLEEQTFGMHCDSPNWLEEGKGRN